MVKLLLALALCVIPAPAYASGLYIPGGLVHGVFWTLAISLGAACSLRGNFIYRFLYFIAGIAASAACAIALLRINDIVLSEKGLRSAGWLIEIFVPAACTLAAWLTAQFASNLVLGEKMREQRSTKMLCWLFGALAALGFVAPYIYSLSASGYGQTFFVSTVLPYVSSVIIALAAIAGFIARVDLKTDYVFRRFFLYWPFATMFVMLICDTTRSFPGKDILQIIVWYPLLLGLPIGTVVFIRRRLKQKAQPPPNP